MIKIIIHLEGGGDFSLQYIKNCVVYFLKCMQEENVWSFSIINEHLPGAILALPLAVIFEDI